MMGRILIEFLDLENINNIISQLHQKYEKVCYLYFGSQRTEKNEAVFKTLTLINKRIIGTEPSYIYINDNSDNILESIDDSLKALLNSEDYFEFDITGGPRAFILAAGKCMEQHTDLYNSGRITIHEYDVYGGKYKMSVPSEKCPEQQYFLSVKEILEIHGTMIEPNSKYKYDLSANNLSFEIRKLWDAVKNISNEWNSFCSLPQKSYVKGRNLYIAKKMVSNADKVKFDTVIHQIERYGYADDIRETQIDGDRYMSFRSNIPEKASFLYEKGGNVLEMYTYLICKENGKYRDCCVGVPLDWDGIIDKSVGETKNEVDLILSDGRVPTFVSCKNKMIENDFLYELETLANHYGGEYAKMIMISSLPAGYAIKKRAEAMNIKLIDNVSNMSSERFALEMYKI